MNDLSGYTTEELKDELSKRTSWPWMQPDITVDGTVWKYTGPSPLCLWDNVEPGAVMGMVCPCPKCSPRC